MSDKKALVALAKEASIQDSVTKVFDLMGGVTNMIKPGTTVMLKAQRRPRFPRRYFGLHQSRGRPRSHPRSQESQSQEHCYCRGCRHRLRYHGML